MQMSDVIPFESQSRKQTRQLLERANENARRSASIVWPKIPEPADYPENEAELALLEFEAIPEFRGLGTPEFRENLEAHFYGILVAARHALAVLGVSRGKLVEAAEALGDNADSVLHIIRGGHDDMTRLLQYLRAAEVRLNCAIAERDMKAEGVWQK
jgi:hypothetical protein